MWKQYFYCSLGSKAMWGGKRIFFRGKQWMWFQSNIYTTHKEKARQLMAEPKTQDNPTTIPMCNWQHSFYLKYSWNTDSEIIENWTNKVRSAFNLGETQKRCSTPRTGQKKRNLQHSFTLKKNKLTCVWILCKKHVCIHTTYTLLKKYQN